MRQIDTQPNTQSTSYLEAHTLDLPQCCPVSRNPFPGSTVTITYRPGQCCLEVASLYAYIHQFKGGLKDDTGTIVVRNMEDMIARIAYDCAQAAGVDVSVCAQLVIAPKQRLMMLVRGKRAVA